MALTTNQINGLFHTIVTVDEVTGNVTLINIDNATVSKNLVSSGNAIFSGNANFSGNTTFTGNLTAANLQPTGKLTIAQVANFSLGGGTNGQVLTTNGSGILSWGTPAATGITSVGATGSGLGFSASAATVGTSSTITLTAPSATALRSSLTIGNVANLNLNGSTSQYLRGDGTWTTVTGGVTSVAAAGSSLGFSLTGGPITSTGTITLNGPTVDGLRSTLNIGNVANINLTGETNKVLLANGAWTPYTSSVTVGNIAQTNFPSVNPTTTYLRGDGQWVTPAGGSGGSGTVTSVGTSGVGALGFNIATASGTAITGAGTLLLSGPSAATLRTTLTIGNVANTNYNGNGSQVLRGDGTWGAASGGVTSVATTGSGLGFSLSGGTITSTGTITLTAPTDTALRSSLNIGNVANLDLNGNSQQVLTGAGSWVAAGAGTVTQVNAAGSGLGFSLSGGPITGSGTITLNVPSTTAMKATLGLPATIGDLTSISKDGNVANVLRGDGTWAAIPVSSNVPNLTGTTTQYLAGDGWKTFPTLGNIVSINTNASTTQYLRGDGTWQTITVPTYTGGNNVTVASGVVSLDRINFLKETVTVTATPTTAIVVDCVTSSMAYVTAVATSAMTINVRGNATTTMNSMLGIGEAITVTAMITNGATPQAVTSVSVDGVLQTVKMISGTDLGGISNAITAYTFTIVKTAAATYTVLGSKAAYK